MDSINNSGCPLRLFGANSEVTKKSVVNEVSVVTKILKSKITRSTPGRSRSLSF
jgi:hypothetical protein